MYTNNSIIYVCDKISLMISKQNYKIESFDPDTASEDTREQVIDIMEENSYEDFPDYPFSREEVRKSWKVKNPYKNVFRWIGRNQHGDVIAYALQVNDNPTSPEYEPNKDVVYANLRVKKAYRRQGIGSEFLDLMKKHTVKMGGKILELFTCNPAAIAYAEKLGLEVKHKHYVNRVFLKDIDWDLMREWVNNGTIKAPGVKLELISIIPDEDLEQFTDLYTETINQAPWGGSTEERVTPESYRVREKEAEEEGKEHWVYCSREPNGELSGLTEVYYTPDLPRGINQELTGVRDKYRERGLGKWLKAQMALYVREKYPSVEYISTGNAVNNGPMLAINHQMGYREVNVFHLYNIIANEGCYSVIQ